MATQVPPVEALLEHGSYLAFVLLLAAAGFGVPVPEETVLVTGGALAHEGVTRLPFTLVACAAGVLAGDVLLFLNARKLGEKALEHEPFCRILPPHRRARLQRIYDRRGGLLVAIARFVPGMRGATFALAGINRMPVRRFVLFDALALCMSAPLVVGLGWLFADRLELVKRDVAKAEHWILIVLVAALALGGAVAAIRSRSRAPRG